MDNLHCPAGSRWARGDEGNGGGGQYGGDFIWCGFDWN